MLKRLERTRRSDTTRAPIGGGRDYPRDTAAWAADQARQTGAATVRAAALLERYGTTAATVLRAEGAVPQMLRDADYSHAELDWLIRHEQIVHLPDLVMRRTALAVTGRLSLRDLRTIAALCATVLDWTDDRRQIEVEQTQAMLMSRHRLRIDQAASA